MANNGAGAESASALLYALDPGGQAGQDPAGWLSEARRCYTETGFAAYAYRALYSAATGVVVDGSCANLGSRSRSRDQHESSVAQGSRLLQVVYEGARSFRLHGLGGAVADRVDVRAASGQLVASYRKVTDQSSLWLGRVPAGVYVVTVAGEAAQPAALKLVVQ